jgi:hypothetical protein
MNRVKLNVPIKEFQRRLSEKTLNSPHGLSIARNRATLMLEKKIDICYRDFLGDVESHPVSEEIKSGPVGDSNFVSEGNLFSFIGFESDEEPIGKLINTLEHQKSKIKYLRKSKEKMFFSITEPDKEFVFERTPMPWAKGRSWVEGIERGISGFGYYLNKTDAGRSKGGIQIKAKINKGRFSNTPYLSSLIKSYVKSLKERIKKRYDS